MVYLFAHTKEHDKGLYVALRVAIEVDRELQQALLQLLIVLLLFKILACSVVCEKEEYISSADALPSLVANSIYHFHDSLER
jgi:hypothetical protein